MIVKLPPNIPFRAQSQINTQNNDLSLIYSKADSVSFSSRVLKLKSPCEPLELVTIKLLKKVTGILDKIKAGDESYYLCDATQLTNEGYKTSDEPLTQIVTKAPGKTPADFTLFHDGKAYDIYLPVGNKLGRIELHIGAIQKKSTSSLNQQAQEIIKQLLEKLTIQKES